MYFWQSNYYRAMPCSCVRVTDEKKCANRKLFLSPIKLLTSPGTFASC